MMTLNKDSFKNAKHILLLTGSDSFANTSALYSYVLTLHKKVSIQKVDDIEMSVSCLSWFDKIRDNAPLSADYIVNVSTDTKLLFDFFIKNEIKINKKMATSLYAGLLKQYKGFVSDDCDAKIFAISSKLIDLGAEYKLVNECLFEKMPLALFRLKAILFQSICLTKNATHAKVYVSSDDLKASGTLLKDAYAIMYEIKNIVNVKRVTLYKHDDENRELKTI